MNSRFYVLAGRKLIGLAFLLVFVLLIALSIALYNKDFTPVATVTLQASTVGNELHDHAEVKVRGVVVGEVRQIASSGNGATLTLAIQPDMVPLLPANVSAELVPTSLFGERYVDLILPRNPTTARLVDGSVIAQDRSSSAIELEKVFDDLFPMLETLQPQKLSVTLTTLSQALDGRGKQLGQTIDTLNSYLTQLGPKLPALDNDIQQFANVANNYGVAAPDIVTALSDFTATTKTLAAQQVQLSNLFSTVTTASNDLNAFLQQNGNNLIRLSTDSENTLQLLARYSPEFPCVLEQLVSFEPSIDAALGKGTSQPGLHITIHSVPAMNAYQPGRDTPVYNQNSGPHCFANTTAAVASSLAEPNSPQQQGLIAELASPGVGIAPSSMPGWSGELLGPLYRGTEVSVK